MTSGVVSCLMTDVWCLLSAAVGAGTARQDIKWQDVQERSEETRSRLVICCHFDSGDGLRSKSTDEHCWVKYSETAIIRDPRTTWLFTSDHSYIFHAESPSRTGTRSPRCHSRQRVASVVQCNASQSEPASWRRGGGVARRRRGRGVGRPWQDSGSVTTTCEQDASTAKVVNISSIATAAGLWQWWGGQRQANDVWWETPAQSWHQQTARSVCLSV